MSLKSLMKFMLNSPLRLLMRADRTLNEMFRAGFVSTAVSEGIYDILKEGPARAEEVAGRLGIGNTEGLEAWLDLGVSLGELSKSADGYGIKGVLSRGIMDERNDTWQAFLRARVEVIFPYITKTPSMLKQDRRFVFSDSYGELFARSSRTVEPILLDIIGDIIPEDGAIRLLEVGCGSGVYLKYASDRNPRLEATGLEMQHNVAEMARRNIADWNIDDRVTIETADIQHYEGGEKFDIATLYNLIYYFPLEKRVGILRTLGTHLKPGGRLVVTTLCRVSSPSIETMNLWSSMTEGCGPLPDENQLNGFLGEAGFADIRSERLIPGFYLYHAIKS